ncbi:FecR family protein [Sulfurospirillum multivorans]|uniref:Membrane regulatory protein FecR n=2 Tax=Sulfurospirillum multivorans TaxID=66821 RepID=A0AA86AQT3_SULMK|nr:FecR domain-containing protein [Sulfurospirillum multivorans]AHJ14008.1 putative membrane regulatory protein FecR [Sulfurospirillum multivorans DSM 12446]QEH07495.1 putative membrane regulatory protein FecR [Sulfurospirillum multivorans]
MSQAWIDEMAALWFTKVQDGLSFSEQRAFKKWLHVNPEHSKAYAQFEALWHDLDGLSPIQNRTCFKKRLKPWFGYACACVVACFFIAFLQWQTWNSRLEFAQNMATPVGAMREYTLLDGTTLFLDTDTNVSVEYYKQKRLVKLHQGQLVLHVSKDAARPLFVEAKNVQIRVTGTLFEVRNVENHVRISVEEGSVEVSHKRFEDGSVLTLASLSAKEQISLDERGFVLSASTLHNDSVAPWRSGRLIFDKTPLREVLFEFERYGAKKTMIASLELASIPLSGSFEVERFGSFLEMLPKVLPLKTLNVGDNVVIEKR